MGLFYTGYRAYRATARRQQKSSHTQMKDAVSSLKTTRAAQSLTEKTIRRSWPSQIDYFENAIMIGGSSFSFFGMYFSGSKSVASEAEIGLLK